MKTKSRNNTQTTQGGESPPERRKKMYFTNIESIEDLKQQYKKLAMDNHPDKGGNTETMQAINNEYQELFEKVKDIRRNKEGKTYQRATTETYKEYMEVIEKLIKMNGITIEIIGSFVWVSGNTKEYKNELKAIKFKWNGTKKSWYLAPDGWHKKSKKVYSMDDVRTMFGSQEVETGQKRLGA